MRRDVRSEGIRANILRRTNFKVLDSDQCAFATLLARNSASRVSTSWVDLDSLGVILNRHNFGREVSECRSLADRIIAHPQSQNLL